MAYAMSEAVNSVEAFVFCWRFAVELSEGH